MSDTLAIITIAIISILILIVHNEDFKHKKMEEARYCALYPNVFDYCGDE